jgi:hypothetical protein
MTLPTLYPPSRKFVVVVRWLGLALLGIVVAAAVAIAASRLASQQIGLASEPVSAGDALAPAAERKAGRTEHRHRATRAPVAPGSSQVTPLPSQPAEPADGEEVESSGPDD